MQRLYRNIKVFRHSDGQRASR